MAGGKTYFFTASADPKTQYLVHFSSDHHWSCTVYHDGRIKRANKRLKFSDVIELLQTSNEFVSLSNDTDRLTQAIKQVFDV